MPTPRPNRPLSATLLAVDTVGLGLLRWWWCLKWVLRLFLVHTCSIENTPAIPICDLLNLSPQTIAMDFLKNGNLTLSFTVLTMKCTISGKLSIEGNSLTSPIHSVLSLATGCDPWYLLLPYRPRHPVGERLISSATPIIYSAVRNSCICSVDMCPYYVWSHDSCFSSILLV